jgi:hypothetical protein
MAREFRPPQEGDTMSATAKTGGEGRGAAGARETPAWSAWPLDARALAGFAFVALQLWLLLRVSERFRLESPTFQRLLWLVFAGFLVHHFLAARMRLPFFLALSAASLPLVLGAEAGGWDLSTGLMRGGAIVGIGAALVALCHLPIRASLRVLLLVAAGCLLALVRGGFAPLPELAPIWPILGSMFMFRLFLYFYELETGTDRPSAVGAASYFLMLPNACFPLFPVVDYKLFRRAQYNDAALRIYQTGLNWMVRGMVQLVLYRLVYYHAYIDAERVADGADLARHLVANFALYLRVSGQFHLVVGILHLFGFNLPETNRRYFLAESFTDFWRRVNIYFKDFIMKVFYYPVAFRLRRYGPLKALLGATAVSFFATWFLHSYQWFWLRGSFPLTTQDTVFWGALGVLVAVNSVWEQRRGRSRSLSRRRSWRQTAGVAARTSATFATITALWSLWSAHSWEEWLALWSFADLEFATWFGLALAIIAGAVLAEELAARISDRGPAPAGARAALPAFPLRAAVTGCLVPALALWALGGPRLERQLGPSAAFVVDSLKKTGLNASDLGAVERGYYENLLEVARFNVELNAAYMNKPGDWLEFFDTDLWQATDDRRLKDLVPSKSEVINGTQIGINRWGMRDGDYAQEKPASTYRVAMLGSSHVLGWGVNDGETFEALVETRWNENRSDGKRTESLNFGVPGYSPFCQLDTLEKKVLQFSPDAVFLIAHAVDPSLNSERFAVAIRSGVDLREPYLRELAERAAIDPQTPDLWVRRRMAPLADEFVAWTYRRIVEISRNAGAIPVWVYMPRVSEGEASRERMLSLQKSAREAGFVTVDLTNVFADEPIESIAFTAWDMHPNARGHALIAQRLDQVIRATPELAFLAGATAAGAADAASADASAQPGRP